MSIDRLLLQAERALLRHQRTLEKETLRLYVGSLREIRSTIADAYAKHGESDGTLPFEQMNKYNRLSGLEDSIQAEVRRLSRRIIGRLKRGISSQYEESYFRTAFALEKTLQAKLAYRPLSKEVLEAAIENPLDRIGWIRRNTENQARMVRQLRDELTRSMIQGRSYRDTTRLIKQRMDAGAENIIRIVRTESHRVQQKGRLESFKYADSQGVVMRKVWIITDDDRIRQRPRDEFDHKNMDGNEVELDKPFVVNGEDLDYPGDPAGSAANIINCRCSHRVKIIDFKSSWGRNQKEGVIPQQTYEEWKTERIDP